MPWSVGDVESHIKGLTDRQKRVWVEVANGALERGEDEGSAIRMANAAAQRVGKAKTRESESFEERMERSMGKGVF